MSALRKESEVFGEEGVETAVENGQWLSEDKKRGKKQTINTMLLSI